MTANIRLGYVIIYVNDVAATIEFYENAFGIKRRFVHESGQYAEMETGSTALAFVSEQMIGESHSFRKNRRGDLSPGAEIAFVVEDVEKQYSIAIQAGAEEVEKPIQKPWGQTVAYVRDNNGFFVELCTQIGA